MTIRHILAGALLGLPLLAAARPASPHPVKVTNPDGTTIEVIAYGNEDFSYVTDLEGRNVLEYDLKGNLRPAMRNGRALTCSTADLNLLRAETQSVTPMRSEGSTHRMAALDNSGRSTYPTVGDCNALVILLEYADTPFSLEDPVKAFDKLCNEPGYSDYNSVGSARDYYMAASNNKFRPNFKVYGPVKLKNKSSYYSGNDADASKLDGYKKTARFGEAIKEAVEALDGEINFADFDLDKNGEVDNIFFFYSGYGAADTGGNPNYVWPHQADFIRYTNKEVSLGLDPLIADGVQIRTYACSNEVNGKRLSNPNANLIDGIGAFVHEYGHVLGLPDLYNTSNMNFVVGDYSVMDHGSYNMDSTCPPLFSAYEKWVCHWIEFTDAVNGESYSVPALSKGDDAKAVRLRIRVAGGKYSSEYFIIETRANESWDRSLGEEGLMIWHIDYDKTYWTANAVNRMRPRINILKSDGELSAFPGPENTFHYITPDSKNAIKPYGDHKSFNPYISNIRYDAETGIATFDYNKYTTPTEAVTVMHDKPEAESAKHDVHLRWDAVEGSYDYLLTVKKVDVSGKETVYNQIEEFSTYGENNFTVRNIADKDWNSTFRAYVRVVCPYPSTKVSNEISFIPSQLPEGTAVETVDADSIVIYGLQGRIVAPENARVFNINGIETGKTDLPAGIYIVVAEGKTVKVAVK